MSLINQVLKDLERRHAVGAESRSLARAVRPVPRERSNRALWLGLLLVIGATGAGTWWYLFQPRLSAPPASPGPAATTAPGGGATARVAPPASLPSAPGQVPPPAVSTPPAVAGLPQGPAAVGTNAGAPTGANVALPAAPSTMPTRTALADGTATREGPAAPPAPEARIPPARAAALAANPAQRDATAAGTARDDGAHEQAARKVAAAPAHKGRHKPAAGDAQPGHGPPGISSSEYPEPNGVQEPNVEKQVRPPSDRERAEAELRQGLIALQSGNAPDAEDHLRQALAIDPLADKARQALLGLYVQRGRREDAERLLEERLRVDNRHAGFAMALARLQLERDGNGEALVTLQRSAPYGESSAAYQAMLANALSRVGRHKEAAQRYQAAIQLAPQSALWYMGLGIELKADNRPAEARIALQRARDLGGLSTQLASYIDAQIRDLQ